MRAAPKKQKKARRRSDRDGRDAAMRTTGEGVPPKSAAAPTVGTEKADDRARPGARAKRAARRKDSQQRSALVTKARQQRVTGTSLTRGAGLNRPKLNSLRLEPLDLDVLKFIR